MASGAISSPVAASAALDLAPSTFRRVPTVKSGVSEAEALKVGREFEAMFLSQLLQPMFETIPTDSVFGGGHGEKMFRSLQVDEYGKSLAKAGGIGIAQAVQREILRMQEKGNAAA